MNERLIKNNDDFYVDKTTIPYRKGLVVNQYVDKAHKYTISSCKLYSDKGHTGHCDEVLEKLP